MEKSEKWAFIVNPTAGNGFANNLIPKLEEMISKHNANAEIKLTESSGHASVLSDLYHERGFNKIIGVGGDGTINEIARPLINKKDVTLGIIPAGTGNDFIQILGFPARFTDNEWDILFAARSRPMDAGRVNGKIFLNGMGLGFDAEVAAENYIEPGKVKKGGAHKYIWHIVKTLLFFNEKRMITTEDNKKVESNCFINTVAIGRRFAGGFFLTPEAVADDGLLDVCSIKKLNLLQRFNLLLKVPGGRHITNRKVNYYKTTGLDLEFSEVVPFHVDGELNFAEKFKIEIIPAALNFIYNPDGNHFFRK